MTIQDFTSKFLSHRSYIFRIFLKFEKIKIRQYDKGIRNGKLPGLHTGQAAV